MRAWPLALAFAGCGFSASVLPDDANGDARPIDAAVDAAPDMMTTQLCLGTMHRICVAAPTSSLSLMTQSINTGTSTLCIEYTATPAVDACVIAGQMISLPSNNTVTVTGTKRLILIASDALSIAGTL